MPSRPVSRGRERTRSRSPLSADSRSRSPSRPRRSISPRSPSPRRNERRTKSPSPVRSTKIVVEKLTKNVKEEHLREIFGVYGQIRDMDMPMNRQFNTNRGTAYILYAIESDAEAAIAHMHESQIDGAVINVSIVLPRRKFSPSPPLARRGANIDPRGPPSASFRGGPPPPRRRSPPRNYRDRELDPDHILPDLDHLEEDGVGDVIARVATVEEGEARATVATAVMRKEAEAEVVGGEAEDAVDEQSQISFMEVATESRTNGGKRVWLADNENSITWTEFKVLCLT